MNKGVEHVLAEVKAGRRMTPAEAVELLELRGRDIYQVIAAAEEVKREQVSDRVTYVINYNLNLSNICVNNCLFCAFNENSTSSAAYRLNFREIKQHLDKVKKEGVSEICLVSGLHPDFDLNTYLEIIGEIKEYLPKIHLHGITPAELEYALRGEDLS
ncbi:MAG: radical SAM protein, partial [Halanaerobacter sp.]